MGPIPTTHTAITVNTVPMRVPADQALQILNHHLEKYHTPATAITTNPLVAANLQKIRSSMLGEEPDLNALTSYTNEGLNLETENGGYQDTGLEGVEFGEDTDAEGMTTDYEANTDIEIDKERRKAEKKARRKQERREAEELKRKRAHDE